MKIFGRAGSTFATVVAAAAVLAVATTGGAVAGGLITSKQIKNNTIKSIDVRDGNLTGTDIADGSVKGADIGDGSVTGGDVADGSLGHSDFTSSPVGLVQGYAWISNESTTIGTAVPLTNAWVYNSSGGAVTVKRTAVGEYTVNFAGLNFFPGNVQVSSYGVATDTEVCKVVGWGSSSADIACFNTAGAAADSPFSLAVIK